MNEQHPSHVLSSRKAHCEHLARHFVALTFRLIVLFFLVILPLFLLVARFHGLGHTISHRVEKALSGEFYEVNIQRLLFSLHDGLIAENLRILEKNPSHRLLVHANRIIISLNFSSLLSRSIQIDALELHRTTIDIPLGNKEEPRLRLDHVEATMISPPEQVILSKADFDLYGIHTHVQGHFLNPKTFAPRPLPKEGPGKIAQTIEKIEALLEQMSWSAQAPTLDLQASGDLTDLSSLRIDHASFHSGPCHYGNWNLKKIDAELNYTDRQLTLEELSLEDTKGVWNLHGNAHFGESKASLYFLGTGDLEAMIGLFAPQHPFAQFHWIDAPHLQGSCSLDWKNGQPLLDAQVEFQAGRFSYAGIPMDHCSLGCAYQGNRFLIRNLEIAGAPGSLKADLMITPHDNRLRLEASLLPQYLTPVAQEPLKSFLSSLDFKDPLKIYFQGSAPLLDPLKCSATGTLHLGSSSLRGAWIEMLNTDFQINNGIADFQHIILTIDKEKAEGECFYDFKNQELRFPEIKSSVDPITVMMWIDPRIAESLRAYRFIHPPQLQVTGKLGMKDPLKNDFHIQLNAPQGLNYTLLKHDLNFHSVAGEVDIKKQDLLINLPDASLFGGNINLSAKASIAPNNQEYSADITLDRVDFKSTTKLYFDYDTSEGELNGNYHFSTIANDPYAMKGQGQLLIDKGNVLAMPVFGPLSSLMNEIYPGLGYQAARRASADFSVHDGVITTKNLSIQSAEFSMIGAGDIFYLQDRINMNMRLNIKGLPGLVLFPVSKLFEYVWDGSLKHSTWKPKYVTLPKLYGK